MNKEVKLNKTFRVLSIDFDYFQNVTKDILKQYPDGFDLSTELSKVVWQTRYDVKDLADKLLTVNCKENELDILKYVLYMKCAMDAPVMVTASHKYIYEFIKDTMTDKGFSPDSNNTLEIYNVDFHPDFYNASVEFNSVDCGNWAYFIKQDFPDSKITWIAPEKYKELYDVDEYTGLDFISTDINILTKQQYDAIFLCRSDAWFPPHLDFYFNDLLNLICSYFITGKIQRDVSTPRDYSVAEKVLSPSELVKKYSDTFNEDITKGKENTLAKNNHTTNSDKALVKDNHAI